MRALFKTEQYFEEYISELQSILDQNKDKVLDDEMKNLRMKVRNCLYREQILIASYSMGASLKAIRKLYLDAVNSVSANYVGEVVKFKMGRKIYDSLYVHHHDSILRLISIGILLDATEELKKLQNKLYALRITNRLFDKLINYKIPNHKITSAENSDCPTAFNRIEKIAFKEAPDEKSLIRLQTNWYSTLNKSYFLWKDSHLTRGRGYFGYWSFSIAAIAKIHSMNSDKLINNIFFPTDMFLGSNTIHQYSISKEMGLLKRIDELICKMGGIRRSTNEILALRKDILRMKKLKYEATEKKVNTYILKIRNDYTHEVPLSELAPYFDGIQMELSKLEE